MRDVVKYINTAGQTQYFSQGNCVCNTKALREFLYTVQNKRLYTNQPKTITIECVFHGSLGERDAIIELLEYDSIKNTLGRLYVNEWYILCKFTGIASIVKEGNGNIRMNLQFQSNGINWSREATYYTAPVEYPTENYQTNDYSWNYPHDYGINSKTATQVYNNELSQADLRIETEITADIIEAHEISFSLTGGDGITHTYEVDLTDLTVVAGQIFVVDTQAKTVEINGNNVFGAVSDDYYIFEQLVSGEAVVISDCPLTITVIEHRRLPKWRT